MADIELVDLEVIARYSLAIRQERAPAEEVLAALDESRAFVLAILDGASPDEADRRARALADGAWDEEEDEDDVEVEEDDVDVEEDDVDVEEEDEEGEGDPGELVIEDEWAAGDEEDVEEEPDPEPEQPVAERAPRPAASGVRIDAPQASSVAAPAVARRGLLRRKPQSSSVAEAEPIDEEGPAPLSADEAAARRAARRARREGRART